MVCMCVGGMPKGGQLGSEPIIWVPGWQPAQPQLLCPQQGERHMDRALKAGPPCWLDKVEAKAPQCWGPSYFCASLASVYASVKWACQLCQLCRDTP